ncbi:hypothetical protein RR48_08181 [Papilio machaon]|uniref:Uncharacterized protein n=1 Tax=Papilio machaon TaxID=76193 RepID=A0A194RJQ2_PAPMA|nr:hypothetical protein RR48_08181 [Papilio machaon]
MRLIIVFILTCCAVGILCDNPPCDTKSSMPEIIRVKRAKYYSSPPQRFYKRPPLSHPTHGAFSYTPPPNHMMDDEGQPPPNHRPNKYSRRPTNEGLGDEDINNLLKYLSKKDLDKIVEHTLAKDKFKKGYDKPLDFPKPAYNEVKDEAFEDGNRFSLNGPYIKDNGDYAPTKENPSYNENYSESRPIVVPDNQQIAGNSQFYSSAPSEGMMSNQQFAVVDGYMQQAINGLGSQSGLNIFTHGKVMQEEQLPIPSNLRYEDHFASFTNNDPAVVKADTSSYKVESFGSLPLMNYDSKLHTVSSYKVPHYTVTSNQNQSTAPQQQSSSSNTRVDFTSSRETKYPDQSDAHLKATKIWTHKSTGTAYYLHKDGTLSLERPRHPKYG